MFIRFYVYADNEEDALHIYKHCMDNVQKYIIEEQIHSMIPYWKFSDMYVIEVSWTWNIDIALFRTFLESISNNWSHYGRALAGEFSLLASETNKDCTYMQSKISMVDMHFEKEEELYLINS